MEVIIFVSLKPNRATLTAQKNKKESYFEKRTILLFSIPWIIFSLVNVTADKTTEDYAWSIVKNLLKELEGTYEFLRFIKIDDLENLENTIDDITVLSDIEHIDPMDLGKAIQNIIDVFRMRMGSNAGYFFIQEFKNDLGDDYYLIIKKMGVDLRLTGLQNEMAGFDSGNYKIKDDRSSNIAFIERN